MLRDLLSLRIIDVEAGRMTEGGGDGPKVPKSSVLENRVEHLLICDRLVGHGGEASQQDSQRGGQLLERRRRGHDHLRTHEGRGRGEQDINMIIIAQDCLCARWAVRQGYM
jgi:hypothetical protein